MWKYLKHNKVKHAFFLKNSNADCGTGRSVASLELWKKDEEGLKIRTECRICLRMQKQPNIYS